MSSANDLGTHVAALLRAHRRARGVTIASLAAEVGVSPRLISEFERGKRPHVSLETTLRLLHSVGAPVPGALPVMSDEADARAARAAHRRQTWRGSHSTVSEQSPPAPSLEFAERLMAVASASQLAMGLRAAHQQQARGRDPKARARQTTR